MILNVKLSIGVSYCYFLFFWKIEIAEPSWEPVSNLENVQNDIQSFEENRQKENHNENNNRKPSSNQSELLFGLDEHNQGSS